MELFLGRVTCRRQAVSISTDAINNQKTDIFERKTTTERHSPGSELYITLYISLFLFNCRDTRIWRFILTELRSFST